MVMRRKQGARAHAALIRDIFDHRACNAHAVIGRSAAADLVQDQQAVSGRVLQNVRHLAHLHHEGGLPARQIVRRADAREHAVHHADVRGGRGHERADLRHDRDQRHLPHIGGLARHIRTGDDSDAVFAPVENGIVRDEQAVGQHFLHDRMTAVPDLDAVGEIHDRTGVVIVTGDIGERAQHIQRRDRLRGLLHAVYLGGNLVTHLDKQFVFQRGQPLLRAEHRAFELLEFIRDVSLAVCQRLLADIIVRHGVQIGFADLDIVAEHAVITDLELTDARALALALLDGCNFALAARGEVTQGVDLLIVARADQAALTQQDGRLVHDRQLDQRAHVLEQVDIAGQLAQHGLSEQGSLLPDLRQAGNSRCQRAQVAAVCCAVSNAADQPLHIEHLFERVGQRGTGDHIVAQRAHRLLAARDVQWVVQRLFQPLADQARAHRGPRPVKHPEQRALFLLGAHGLAKFKVAPRDQVKLHILSLMVDLQVVQCRKAGLLGLTKVIQQPTQTLHGLRKVGQPGRVKILNAEVLHHPRGRALRIKAFLRHGLDKRLQPLLQKAVEGLRRCGRAADQHLTRGKAAEFAGNILPVIRPGSIYLARCDVGKAYADAALHGKHAPEKVVAVLVQHGGFHDRTRRHAPDDLALDQALGELGVLHLLADRDLVALAHELGDIPFRAVVRHAAHGRTLLQAAVAAGER